MDKNSFDRERYRLGHTLVFFRAGALGFLEEIRLAAISSSVSNKSLRDELVIKWVRKIQGEVLKRVRRKVRDLFEKINDKQTPASSYIFIFSRFMRRRGIRGN